MSLSDIKYWADASGKRHRVRPSGYRLRPTQNKDDAALRAFVFVRDDFTCRKCGHRPATVPENYDGRDTAFPWGGFASGRRTDLHIDHIFPRSCGGGNHPENLQTLCFPCNAGKRDRIAAA